MIKNNASNKFLSGLMDSIQDTDDTSEHYDKFASDFDKSNAVVIPVDALIPAPIEWNFYAKLNESKKIELITSIAENGLLHPIVVWEQKGGKYMILSGHNRVDCFKELYEMTKDGQYKNIKAVVKRRTEITEEQAQEIIVDTNWVARQLSPLEKSRSIYKKYATFKNEGSKKKGQRVRDIIAEQYGVSGRQIENYLKLNSLSPEFTELLETNKLSIKSAAKIAVLTPEMQRWLYDTFNSEITNRVIEKMNGSMTKEDICELFSRRKNSTEKIAFKINPKHKSEVVDIIEKALCEKNISMEWLI